MSKNLLTINAAKTKIMFLGLPMHPLILANLEQYQDTVSGSEEIEAVDSYKYLGVMLDTRLTFSN